MKKKVGLIGVTGRMGSILSEMIKKSEHYDLGTSFAKTDHSSSQGDLKISENLNDVFKENDYVIDFSSKEITGSVFHSCLLNPRPLVMCTTGWGRDSGMDLLINRVAAFAPLIIASNTSIGACLQNYLVRQLVRVLDEGYDIDLLEKHHKNKVDAPSGTALSLLKAIKDEKHLKEGAEYAYVISEKREKQCINVNIQRSGNLPGEHEVSFTNDDEMISIKHISFNRGLFAKGAIKALNWIRNSAIKTGLYDMFDVLGMKL